MWYVYSPPEVLSKQSTPLTDAVKTFVSTSSQMIDEAKIPESWEVKEK